MIGHILEWCARYRALVLFAGLALGIGGFAAMRRVQLDAIPDLSDSQVIVFTEWPGRSPTLVEDQVTYPLVTSLLGTPNVEEVRGQSMFGMSFVYVVFEEGTDAYWARSRVLEYLNTVQSRLPEGAMTRLGPDASGVGWVFQYALVDESGKRDSGELRTLHDFSIRYALASVEGVRCSRGRHASLQARMGDSASSSGGWLCRLRRVWGQRVALQSTPNQSAGRMKDIGLTAWRRRTETRRTKDGKSE